MAGAGPDSMSAFLSSLTPVFTRHTYGLHESIDVCRSSTKAIGLAPFPATGFQANKREFSSTIGFHFSRRLAMSWPKKTRPPTAAASTLGLLGFLSISGVKQLALPLRRAVQSCD